MSRNDLVWQSFLPLESIKLGRLVLNLDEPHQDYWDPTCDLTPEILKRPQLRYLDVQSNATNKGFTAELTSLASASRSKQKTRLAAVTTEQSTVYQLANSGQWFKASLKDQGTRKWIEEVIGTGDGVYVVVGYQTMIDAKALRDTARSKDSQARFQLPMSEAASAIGAVMMVSGLADPALDIYRQSDHGLRKQFVAAGEQVYAVQYRKVRFKWYSSRDLDRAALEKGNRWKVYGSLRGQEVGANDVVEATISDDGDSDGEEIVTELS
jgi:hypothetical protein